MLIESLIVSAIVLPLAILTLFSWQEPVWNDPNRKMFTAPREEYQKWHWERRKMPVWVWILLVICCLLPLVNTLIFLIIVAGVFIPNIIFNVFEDDYIGRFFWISGEKLWAKMNNNEGKTILPRIKRFLLKKI